MNKRSELTVLFLNFYICKWIDHNQCNSINNYHRANTKNRYILWRSIVVLKWHYYYISKTPCSNDIKSVLKKNIVKYTRKTKTIQNTSAPFVPRAKRLEDGVLFRTSLHIKAPYQIFSSWRHILITSPNHSSVTPERTGHSTITIL